MLRVGPGQRRAFYKGKQMRLIVGSAVGGGYDLYSRASRALARHMVRHIPGNPTMIVQNQPAAGGMILTNQLYNQGPKDGTVLSATRKRICHDYIYPRIGNTERLLA
jgi:tripartite-type tricarboxylate transporter receptor subunit TctC